MTPNQARETFGPIILQTHNAIIRAKPLENGVQVTVHHKQDGVEITPRGYWLGSNMLQWEAPK